MTDKFVEELLQLPLVQFDVGSLLVILIIYLPVTAFIFGSCLYTAFDFVKNCLTLRKRIVRDVLKLLVVIDRPVTLAFVCEYCDLMPFHVKRYYDVIYSLVYEHNYRFGLGTALESKEDLLTAMKRG